MDDEDKMFIVKNNINVEGIDENFVWYESQILREAMRSWSYKFEKIVRVMEARHKEHLQMLATVMDENAALKKQFKDGLAVSSFPPKRKWVGLTDEELERLIHNFGSDPHTLLDEVGARLKERNSA